MKTSLQKLVGITLVLSLAIGSYFLFQNNDENQTDTQFNQVTQSSHIQTIGNSSKNSDKSLVTPYVPNKDTYTKLDTNINNLNEMLEQTKKALKQYNNTQPNNGIISNNEIDKLLTLDVESNVKNKDTSVEFEKKETKIDSSEKLQDKVNYSSASNNINNTLTTTTAPISTTPPLVINKETAPSQVNPSVSSEILKLQTEISEVKQIINKLSSNQL